MTADEDASVIAERIVRRLTDLGLTLACAESCTGGLIGHLVTNVPGSSACFRGGVISYDNETKMRLLGVPEALLEAHGAVSEPVAAAMAQGAVRVLEADIAVAVTGIAGPGGGSESKPVGLVYWALSDRGGHTLGRHRVWSGNRESNKLQSATAALALIEEYLAAHR